MTERLFKISQDWIKEELGTPIERACLAKLSISAGDEFITKIEDEVGGATRSELYASAYSLAEWFAGNWWRLVWEPESSLSSKATSWYMSHSLASVGGGFVWPDTTFSSDGEVITISSKPYKVGSLRFLAGFERQIQIADFCAETDSLVARVLERLSSMKVKESNLALIWKELVAERNSPKDSAWRKLEAMLSFDPDEAPVALIEKLNSAKESFGSKAVEEIAAYSKSNANSHLRALWADIRKKSPVAKIQQSNKISADVGAQLKHGNLPWQNGEIAAQVARKSWGLPKGPVSNQTLSNLFGISKAVIDSPQVHIGPMNACFRGNKEGDFSMYFKGHGKARRFYLLRLVGDALVSPLTERILPSTPVKTSRQKFQRAFAREFLCPFEELKDYLGSKPIDEETIDESAEHFDVSSETIKNTLFDKGILTPSFGRY